MSVVRRPLSLGAALAAIALVAFVVAAPRGGATAGGQGPLASPTPAIPVGSAVPTLANGGTPPGSNPGGTGVPVVGGGPGSSPGTESQIVATRVRVERLGIDLPIVEGDGLDAPLGAAAHYPGTGWPGGGTNIYLYAHARDGMFLALWDARPGDEIELDLVDGSARLYRVSQVLPRVPWNAIHYTKATPDEQLTLQTSTGNTATSPRFIVIAVPETEP